MKMYLVCAFVGHYKLNFYTKKERDGGWQGNWHVGTGLSQTLGLTFSMVNKIHVHLDG